MKNKLLALSKKESVDILTNKIYILLILVQLFIVCGAFLLAFTASIITDTEVMDNWRGNSMIGVGLTEDLKNSSIEEKLKDEKLSIRYYKNLEEYNRASDREKIAIIYPKNSRGDLEVKTNIDNMFFRLVSNRMDDALINYQRERKLKNMGFNDKEIDKIENRVEFEEIPINEDKKVDIALNSSYFIEFIYGFILPFIALLPFFLGCNIVTDSIVGEKERKTFEVLLMTPLSSYIVIIGKTLPILLFSLIQSLAWLILFILFNVPIYHLSILFLFLFFIGLIFTGLGIIISIMVDSTKEANSAITLLLFLSTFILFMPLFMNIPSLNMIFDLLPTVLIIKIAANPILDWSLVLNMLPTIILSIVIFIASIYFFRQERALRL